MKYEPPLDPLIASAVGQQEGMCNGCGVMFPFRNFTVDHMVPQSEAGRTTWTTCNCSAGPATPSKATDPRST